MEGKRTKVLGKSGKLVTSGPLSNPGCCKIIQNLDSRSSRFIMILYSGCVAGKMIRKAKVEKNNNLAKQQRGKIERTLAKFSKQSQNCPKNARLY